MINNINIKHIATDYDFDILDIFLDNDGIAAPADLSDVILPDNINFQKGIVINGRAPIWLYAHLVHLCHAASYVAVFDPRHGAIVVQRHSPDAPKLGHIIHSDIIYKYITKYNLNEKNNQTVNKTKNSKVIAFLGPPHSGKSVLLSILRKELMRKMPNDDFQKEFFILRACPDGEGNWFSEIPNEQAMTLRYKNKFNDDFINSVCQHLFELKKRKSLIFVDCGGKIDKYNQLILNLCTHSIIVSSDPSSTPEWRGASKASNVKVIAEIDSKLDRIKKIISISPLKIELGPLSRDSDLEGVPSEFLKRVLE